MPRRTKKASHKGRGGFTKDAIVAMKALGETVKYLRNLAGVEDKTRLAYLTGRRVSRQYVSSLEKGGENPTLAQLVHLASALHVPLAVLFLSPPMWIGVNADREAWDRRVRQVEEKRNRKRRRKRRRASAPPDV